eukprot:CAMPEP_0196818880 /NCGR_PEP_ID=MMETSP1362-20130617/67960_1 /TAXON_ID=163516 /ORGANISM="Leptocylindrus danicus, Strain CCMP1856" /LENGTH=388 /DNA_ID=CAMNT_0042197167 /DNA_START=385 /DNA_END=1552 /DNA_ORIENTATION=+
MVYLIDNNINSTRRVKIICVGPASAGKTSLIRRYCINRFDENRSSTRGTDFLSKRVTNPLFDGEKEGTRKTVVVQLFDTAGQEQYGKILSPAFYRGADGALLIYDATSRQSFIKCLSWYNLVRRHCYAHANSHGFPIVVVANKLDILFREVAKPMRVVPQRQVFPGLDYARKYNGPGLKRASVEDIARAAGGMDALRAVPSQQNSSYGSMLASSLEPPPHDCSGSNGVISTSSKSVKSAWSDQSSDYYQMIQEWENSSSNDITSNGSSSGSLQILSEDDDDLPDRESILLWCRQHGLGHMETSALDGTGVETAVNAVVMLALQLQVRAGLVHMMGLPPEPAFAMIHRIIEGGKLTCMNDISQTKGKVGAKFDLTRPVSQESEPSTLSI